MILYKDPNTVKGRPVADPTFRDQETGGPSLPDARCQAVTGVFTNHRRSATQHLGSTAAPPAPITPMFITLPSQQTEMHPIL